MSLEKRLVDALNSKNKIIIEETFKLIYDSYFKLVYFCVGNYVDNKDDVEELVNDVFLNFFNHLNNINVNGSIKYYLTSSAKNSALNFLKKQKRVVVTENIENVGVEYKYHDNDLIDKVKENLTFEESQLVIDHVIVGRSLREIAKENNTNANTLKSKYRRAILKLQKVLGGRNHE